MSDLVEQIDALLALNAKGAVSHTIPGLAVELLERAKAALSASPTLPSQVVGVTVKPLEWIEDEQNWWTTQPPVMIGGAGYEVRITGIGKVRARRGNEDWFYFEGSADEAKAHWQADFNARIQSCITSPAAEAVAYDGPGLGDILAMFPSVGHGPINKGEYQAALRALAHMYHHKPVSAPSASREVTDELVELALDAFVRKDEYLSLAGCPMVELTDVRNRLRAALTAAAITLPERGM